MEHVGHIFIYIYFSLSLSLKSPSVFRYTYIALRPHDRNVYPKKKLDQEFSQNKKIIKMSLFPLIHGWIYVMIPYDDSWMVFGTGVISFPWKKQHLPFHPPLSGTSVLSSPNFFDLPEKAELMDTVSWSWRCWRVGHLIWKWNDKDMRRSRTNSLVDLCWVPWNPLISCGHLICPIVFFTKDQAPDIYTLRLKRTNAHLLVVRLIWRGSWLLSRMKPLCCFAVFARSIKRLVLQNVSTWSIYACFARLSIWILDIHLLILTHKYRSLRKCEATKQLRTLLSNSDFWVVSFLAPQLLKSIYRSLFGIVGMFWFSVFFFWGGGETRRYL